MTEKYSKWGNFKFSNVYESEINGYTDTATAMKGARIAQLVQWLDFRPAALGFVSPQGPEMFLFS